MKNVIIISLQEFFAWLRWFNILMDGYIYIEEVKRVLIRGGEHVTSKGN